MKRWIAAAAVVAMAAAPAAAQTASTPLKARAGKPFTHRHSRIALPATIDGIARSNVRQLGSDELDVNADYAGDGEFVTFYVTRLVSGAVPVWFDRARASVERRGAFGTPVAVPGPVAFVPPGQTAASGLAVAWSSGDARVKGTMLAILPVGEWMVKLRYSSATRDGAALRERLPAVLAQIDLPRIADAAPAAEVTACTTPLALTGDAKPVTDAEARMQGALMTGLLASARTSSRGKPAVRPNEGRWCRDGSAVEAGAAYRLDGAADAYLLALSDAGRGIWITPDVVAREMAAKEPAVAPRWLMSLADMGRTLVFAPLDRLPPPAQAVSLVEASAPVAVATTWGKPNVTFSQALFR